MFPLQPPQTMTDSTTTMPLSTTTMARCLIILLYCVAVNIFNTKSHNDFFADAFQVHRHHRHYPKCSSPSTQPTTLQVAPSTTRKATYKNRSRNLNRSTRLEGMKRPIVDRIASTLFKLETDRVNKASVVDENGRIGEPMEWSEPNSFANKFSQLVSNNNIGYMFKQWVADVVAGRDYDPNEVSQTIEDFIQSQPVVIFGFTTCPFCRRAKDLLDLKGISYTSMELDELEGNRGNEIRAMLGRKTKRTSVPSIFIGGNYIGGCNDGNPGLIPLEQSGELDNLLQQAGAL